MTTFKIVEETKNRYLIEQVVRVGNDTDNTSIPKVQRRWVEKDRVRTIQKIVYTTPEEKFGDGTLSCYEIGRRICIHYGLEQFCKRNKFIWDWFYGARSKYENYYYFPIKVNELLGTIVYHKNGKVSKTNKSKYI